MELHKDNKGNKLYIEDNKRISTSLYTKIFFFLLIMEEIHKHKASFNISWGFSHQWIKQRKIRKHKVKDLKGLKDCIGKYPQIR